MNSFMLQRKQDENEISFKDLLNSQIFINWTGHEHCCHNIFTQKKIYDFNNTKFLIIQISNEITTIVNHTITTNKNSEQVSQRIRLTTKITNFNPESVKIPNSLHNDEFICHSAIIHYNFQTCNHFTIIVRKPNNNWIEISDNRLYNRNSFPTNLENVHLLFLEKKV